jgi:hypothetical protein
MKLMFVLMSASGLLVLNTLAAGSEAIIKQRAKELSNQNNVQQGVPPPSQSPAAAPKPAAAAPSTPLTPQQALAKLQTDLAAVKVNSTVTPAQKQQLARDFTLLAQGSRKPSPAAANKLAEDMSAALAQKSLTEGTRSRLAQNLNAVLNPGNISASQMQEIVSDVQAIFQVSGLPRKDAVAIADSVKAIGAELQKPAAH